MSRPRNPKQDEMDLPVQPVNKPILCSPFVEPTEHWVYRTDTGVPYRHPDRRPASYWYKTQATTGPQMNLVAEEERDELPLVNALRGDVKAWREKRWDGASTVTKDLLRHWTRDDRLRRLFFCQMEAVETIIYLQEILEAGRRLPRQDQNMAVTRADYDRLRRGQKTTFEEKRRLTVPPRLLDRPNEPGMPDLLRYGCKMATGSGKTVVMAMLIAWAFCNRGRGTSRDRYASAVLVVCPNLTIKERLQVLRPENSENYYQAFDLVPSQLMPELAKGKVLVTNWHGFLPESPHAEGGKSYIVVNKGEESPEAFGRRVLGDLYDRGPLLVLNDEAHHAYRPALVVLFINTVTYCHDDSGRRLVSFPCRGGSDAETKPFRDRVERYRTG
ncbi:MAG: DEAD/DEAH box helicase family protein, partial [Deltaproteobacteria bacterium]|nr:DEAD/DEAH box helicase family protein [Deltaproteobacteria bacterium]